MNLSFGARLRLQREKQQIPLEVIAERTKINRALLEGLERDDVSRWPRGIFRRSYFRDYVHAIGLDPDPLLRQFLDLYPETCEEVTTALSKVADAERRRPPSRLRSLIDSAVGALPTRHLQRGHQHGSEGATEETPSAEMMIALNENEQVAERGTNGASVRPAPVLAATSDAASGSDASPVDFTAVARLCTRLSCAVDLREVTPVLEDAARLLKAVGLTLWIRDPLGRFLTPVFAYGYSEEMTARLPRVPRDSENAIAMAFSTADTRVVEGRASATGAVVVPLITPGGCSGVLALELRHQDERRECVQASLTILAAQLATLFDVPVLAEAVGA